MIMEMDKWGQPPFILTIDKDKLTPLFEKLLIVVLTGGILNIVKMVNIKTQIFMCKNLKVEISLFHVFVSVPDNHQEKNFSFLSNISKN